MPIGQGSISMLAFLSIVAWHSAQAVDEWPQWRGPHRDGVAAQEPKLLDQWPKEGPPLVWKSDRILGYEEGGCSSPVVADGKVFIYVNWRQPIDGGNTYKPVTAELLRDSGWLPDLPEELAKKIETARLARPATRGAPIWYDLDAPTEAEIDAFLENAPELKAYIKQFVESLPAPDAQKYGAYTKRRFCMYGSEFTWDELVKLNAMLGTECTSLADWNKKRGAVLGNKDPWDGHQGVFGSFSKNAFMRTTRPVDSLVCLDAATGKTLWQKDFPGDWRVLKGKRGIPQGGFFEIGASGTPAVMDGKCFVAGFMGLYCISTKDGSLLWQAKTEPAHASPLAYQGKVYHYGTAYRAADGQVLWNNPTWKAAWSVWSKGKFISPALWTSNGKDYVVSSDGGNGWVCMDGDTGKRVWSFEGAACEWCSPVVSGDYLSVIVGSPMELRTYKLTEKEAELAWKKPVGGWGTLIIYQDHVFAYTNVREFGPTTFYCLDLKSGDQVWTSQTYPNSEGGTSCMVACDGKVINILSKPHGGRSFSLELVSAQSKPGSEYVRLGEFDPKMLPLTSPAMANGALILRQNDGVSCYNLRAR